jgi:hypothetical protein
MMPTALIEDDLTTFLEKLPADSGINVRSVIHAWISGGGHAQVGKLTVRLLGGGDKPFTAGTVHAPRVGHENADLELSRILLEQHGVDWVHWSDEFADLGHHNFDASVRLPTLTFDERLTATEAVRLINGVRDLAQMVA